MVVSSVTSLHSYIREGGREGGRLRRKGEREGVGGREGERGRADEGGREEGREVRRRRRE